MVDAGKSCGNFMQVSAKLHRRVFTNGKLRGIMVSRNKKHAGESYESGKNQQAQND